ncbi:hypothetical protein N7489_010429 [Penicillium chrysogenum]|uniref:DUF7598 domain-containing protein n=1 Tax=Penicillium chrysogenum TaxID=5076 RepID=A0ABQ8WUN1_PENCH|nr:uncharacterized protein N7489_010429 [Penicillium chrysogenum]KAJ5229721.1 hypothetical protein N7489_010429 [Penicillium chrysogenum]KAJ5259125.1 hypothetical protein N7524_010681 [Penicillium chrysogenum]KAJ5282394.1 hypothetical protein N7505_000374 [Penicillium chrysogenum]KAJ6169600.1 hypothetical protein N7497_002443 [Penicillium chrysogenum]
MMTRLRESLAGPGYVILNVIRVLNIITFMDLIAACAVLLAKIDMLNSFFFFEAVTHAVVALVSLFMIISELPVLQSYFDNHWPMFGQESSFYSLGGIMMILGVATLGNLNTKAMTQETIGMTFWRIIISAGVLAMIVSVVNVLASYIFSDPATGVSARQVRVDGAVAPQKAMSRTSSHRTLHLSVKREETLPTYTRQNPVKRATKRLTGRFPLKISKPMNPTLVEENDAASSKYSRDSAEIRPPDLAHHPAMYSGHMV